MAEVSLKFQKVKGLAHTPNWVHYSSFYLFSGIRSTRMTGMIFSPRKGRHNVAKIAAL